MGSSGQSGWKDALGSWGPEPGPNPCPAEEGATEGPGQGWGLPGNWVSMPARAGGWQCSWQGAQRAGGRASGHAPWLVRAPAAELPKAVLQSGHWHGGHSAGQEAGASPVPRPQGMPGAGSGAAGRGNQGEGRFPGLSRGGAGRPSATPGACVGLLEGASSLRPASRALSTDKQMVVASRLPGVRQSSPALTVRSRKFYLKHHEDWAVRSGELWPRTGGGPLAVLPPHASSLGLQGLLLLPPLRENSHTSLLNESVPSNPEECLLMHTHAHACTHRHRSRPYPDLLTHAHALVPEAVKQAAVFTGFTTSIRWASYNLTYITSTPSGQHFLEDSSFIYSPPDLRPGEASETLFGKD